MLVLLIICFFLGLNFNSPALAQTQEATPLHFTVAEWATEVRDEGDYDPNPGGKFDRGQRGYAYLEIEGFSLGEHEGFLYLTLNVDVALETRNGIQLFLQRNVLELEEWYIEPPSSTWFYIWVDIPWWAPKGVYKAVITVRDQISKSFLEEMRELHVN